MIDCADSTSLRAHLDHPDTALEGHLDTCETCSGLLRSVAADAGYVRRTLAALDPPTSSGPSEGDVEAALAAILAEAAPMSAPVVRLDGARRRRSTVRRFAVAAAAVLALFVTGVTPIGRDALAGVLDAFRGERFQVVSVNLAEWAASIDEADLESLGSLGEVDTSGLGEPDDVADVATAEAVSGMEAPHVDEQPDRWAAMAPGTIRLDLVARPGNGVPDRLDGAALIVDVPGALGAIYGPADGLPELVVGRSGQVAVRAEGAQLAAIRTFLLDHDALPRDLANQLADIDDWRSTIPLPVPIDGPGWEEVEVAGRRAIAFGDDTGVGALVLREDPDGVTVVGGQVGITRALRVAGDA